MKRKTTIVTLTALSALLVATMPSANAEDYVVCADGAELGYGRVCGGAENIRLACATVDGDYVTEYVTGGDELDCASQEPQGPTSVYVRGPA